MTNHENEVDYNPGLFEETHNRHVITQYHITMKKSILLTNFSTNHQKYIEVVSIQLQQNCTEKSYLK